MAQQPTTRTTRAAQVVALLAAPLLLLLVTAGSAQAQSSGDTVELPVTFTVENTNETEIDCEADGETYQVRGHIVAPEGMLDTAATTTLYLHGLSYGEFFLNFEEVPDYDFAEKQAQAGHVSVVVDRLGYDSSDKPAGSDICFGSRATIAHQLVQDLRSGDYETEGADSQAFSQVVLAGHSVGSIIAQAEAYTFDDIDGLMVLSYSDTTVSPAAMQALQQAIAECEAGGTQADEPEGPEGYVFFGETQELFVMAHFFTDNAQPEVVETTANIRNRDPCGDITSYMAAVDTNLAHLGEIDVPTLVLIGEEDAIYPIQAEEQASLLTGVEDITAVNLAATGHAVTLHETADEFQATTSQWLNENGFGGQQMGEMPKGGVDTGGGGTQGRESLALFGFAGAAFAAAAGMLVLARRRDGVRDES